MLTEKMKKVNKERNQRIAAEKAKMDEIMKWNPDPNGRMDEFASEYGLAIQKFLKKQLDLAIEENSNGYEDNWRHAKKSDSISVARYMYHKKQGCCGFYDSEVVGPDGETYLLGFNYGH